MVKSILAVIGGYAIFGISAVALFKFSGQHPHAAASTTFVVGSTIYGIAFAFLAGVVAAWLAPSRPVAHAIVVAGIIALAATASLFARPQEGQVWSQLVALILMAPATLLGGWWWAARTVGT